MMLILLAILVGTVPSESSLVNSDYRVHNDHCKYSEVKQQPFKEIANSSLRSFLLRKLRGIGDTDCVQSYQVEFNNDSNPFYVFRIDRETRFSRNYTVCGVVTVVGGDFMWKSCDKSKFKDYLLKCESEENRHPQLPPVLSCDRTPNPVSPVSPPNEDAPPTLPPRSDSLNKVTPSNPPIKDTPHTPPPRDFTTIPPRAVANEKSTTKKGFLSKLNCFTCF